MTALATSGTPSGRSPFADVIDRFGAKQITPRNQDLDQHPQDLLLIRELLLGVGRLGLYGAVIPPEFGGTGPDSLALHEGIDALASHNAGLAMSTMPTYLLARAVATYGSADQRSQWLSRIADGRMLGSWAVTEPDTGSDVAAITTRARRDGDGWVISGRKMFITNAVIADVILLLARTGEDGHKGQLTTFVFPMDHEGVSVTRTLEKMGLRSSPTCEVSFDNVRVDDTERLGEVGQGWDIGMDVLDYERLAIPAITAGMSQRAVEECQAYAESRPAFGGHLTDLAPVQAMLADMAAGLLEARLLYRYIAGLVDSDRPAILEGSIGKLIGGRLANLVTSLGVQVHGGYGYIREFEVERLYRDARLFTIGGGTSEIQQKIIAAQLRRETKWPRRAAVGV